MAWADELVLCFIKRHHTAQMCTDSIHTIRCKLSIILYYQISWVTLYTQTTHTTYGQSQDFQSMWSEEKLNKEMLLRLKAEKKKIDILWMRLSLWHFFFTCMTFETPPCTSLNASLNCTPNNQPVLLVIFSHTSIHIAHDKSSFTLSPWASVRSPGGCDWSHPFTVISLPKASFATTPAPSPPVLSFPPKRRIRSMDYHFKHYLQMSKNEIQAHKCKGEGMYLGGTKKYK